MVYKIIMNKLLQEAEHLSIQILVRASNLNKLQVILINKTP